MGFDEILGVLEALAKSQGFYGRMLNAIDMMDPVEFDAFKEKMEAKNFADAVDVVMFFEA